MELDYFEYMGVKVHNTNYADILKTIDAALNDKAYICATCVGTVMEAVEDDDILAAINNALLSIPDGTPLVWYGKFLGCKRLQRVPGPYLMKKLLNGENQYKHYLLGDTQETIDRVIKAARERRNNIQISGHSPPFKPEFDAQDNKEIFEKINQSNPDIIWVSLGGGRQDKWMHKHYHMLNRGIMVGVGAAFRFYTEQIYTPPKIIQRMGLQWFFRMLENPIPWFKRLFPKYVWYAFNFPWQVLKYRLKMLHRNRAKIGIRSNPPQ